MAKRFDWLDISKGIAIFLVIVGHSLPIESTLRHVIFTFHMPLFFIAAGFTFKVKPWRELVSSSFERLLLPYMLVFVLWQGVHFFTDNAAVGASDLFGLLMQFIFASGTTVEPFGFNAVGMTWFLVALFCSRLLMNGFMMLFERHSVKPWLQGVLFLVIAAAAAFVGGKLRIYLAFDLDISLFVLLYMWVGFMFKRMGLVKLLPKWYIFAIALVVWGVSAHFSYFELAIRRYSGGGFGIVAALAGTYVVFALSYGLERLKQIGLFNPIERFFLFCGKNSMGIFVIHAMDWWIPWTALPLLAACGASAALWLGIAFRCLYAVLFVALMKKA